MVAWGEIFVTVTAASYLLGRKELPKIARVIGVYSGRSVGAIVRAKKEFFDATKDSELVKACLQQEFQKGIAELNEIRSELTSVGNISRPLQPQGSAPSPDSSSTATTAAVPTPAGGAAGMYQQQYFPGSAAAATGVSSAATRAATAPTAPGRSSLSLASVDFAALEDADAEHSAEASLAIAEKKLSERGTFAPRLESLEGGADYVSASIVDSLLLRKVSSPGSKQ